jgi:mannosyltransferase OCH1-like enzyme
MPEEYAEYGRQWRELNPDHTLMEWNETSIWNLFIDEPDLAAVAEDLYRRDAGKLGIELYVQLADLVGYLTVWHYGGTYVNCDMQPLRALPQMPDGAWASYENNEDYRIVNAAIGAETAHNSFWRRLLDELPVRYFANPSAEMVETTGPALLTDMARLMPQLEVLPKETFNSVHWKDVPAGGDAAGFEYPESAIAVHHWGHRKDGRSNTVETGTQR